MPYGLNFDTVSELIMSDTISNKNSPQLTFYVNDDCIACDTCVGISPTHFSLSDDKTYALVQCQPKTSLDITHCIKALELCPVEAIQYNE